MKKKQIIFFLANFGQGGAGKSIVRICNRLNRKKFDIAVMCLKKCYYKNELIQNNIEVIEINKERVFFSKNEIKKNINYYLKKNKKIIFVSNLFYSNAIISLFLKKNNNFKLIFSERTPFQELNTYFDFVDFIKKLIIKLILKINYKKANLIIANSKKTAEDIKKFSGKNVLCIYSPSFKNAIDHKKKIHKKIRLLSVGRLSKEKNYYVLINYLSKINNIEFSLKIVGDGPEKNKLIQFIKKNNLNKKIKILSFKNNLKKYFIEADLFISPSKFEGFPNSVVEAISYNIPVLSSKSHGGINEILRSKNYGLLYDTNSFYSFESNLKYFIKNREMFVFSKKNVEKNFKNFTVKACSMSYKKIFEKI